MRAASLEQFPDSYRREKYESNVLLLSALIAIAEGNGVKVSQEIHDDKTKYSDVRYEDCWKDVPYVPLVQKIWYGESLDDELSANALAAFRDREDYTEFEELPDKVSNLKSAHTIITTTNEICTQYFCMLIKAHISIVHLLKLTKLFRVRCKRTLWNPGKQIYHSAKRIKNSCPRSNFVGSTYSHTSCFF